MYLTCSGVYTWSNSGLNFTKTFLEEALLWVYLVGGPCDGELGWVCVRTRCVGIGYGVGGGVTRELYDT